MKLAMTTMLAVVVAMVGCAEHQSGNVNILDDKLVNSIQEGKTTKAEILSMFGEPAAAVPMGDGKLIWNYSADEGSASGASFIPLVGGVVGHSNQMTRTLIITFRKDGVVEQATKGQRGTANAK